MAEYLGVFNNQHLIKIYRKQHFMFKNKSNVFCFDHIANRAHIVLRLSFDILLAHLSCTSFKSNDNNKKYIKIIRIRNIPFCSRLHSKPKIDKLILKLLLYYKCLSSVRIHDCLLLYFQS